MEQVQKATQSDTSSGAQTAELFCRQYDVLHRLTTQMLATRTLEDKLSLVLDAVNADLGYSHAALGLIDADSGETRIGLALGFPDNESILGTAVPAKIGSPVGTLTLGGKPVWIRRVNGAIESQFLDSIGSPSDLLALPLIGGRWLTMINPESARKHWVEPDLDPEKL